MTLSTVSTYISQLVERLQRLVGVLTFKPFDTSTEEGRSKERYRRVVLTAASSIANKGVTTLTSLVSVPLTVHYLGNERYGLWATISSSIAFLAFADLGIGNGLLNAVSKADGSNDRDRAMTAVSSAFFMLAGLSAILLAAFSIIYRFVHWERIFNVTSNAAVLESGPTVAVLVVTWLINMPLGVTERTQRGYQEGYVNQIWVGLGAILGLGGVILTINLRGGLPWLVLAMTGGPLVATLGNGARLFLRSRPWLMPNWRHFDLKLSKELVGAGMVFLFLQVFTLIGNSADNIIIAHVLGASAVAAYSVAKRLFIAVQLGQFAIQPLWPAFGEAMARSDFEWARKTLKRVLAFSLVASGLVSLPLLIIGKWIVTIWVGPSLVPPTALLVGLFLWALLGNYGGAMSVFLNSGSLVRKQSIFVGLASVSSVLLQVLFARWWGTAGVIWGVVAGYGLFYIGPAYRLAFRSLNLLIERQGARGSRERQ